MTVDRPEPGHPEIQELLGVYALDAVDAATAAAVERHLATCPRCTVEVAHHHEVAGMLATSGGEAPPGVWDGIAERLEGSGPPSWERLAARLDTGEERGPGAADGPDRAASGVPRRRASRWLPAAAVVVGAAAAVVAIVLGVRVDHLDHQVSALRSSAGLTAAERAALARPSTRQVDLTAPAGSGSSARAVAVVTASGSGFLEAARLPALPTDRTYQLWAVLGGQTISLGLLGRAPAVVAFSVAGNQPVRAFAITDEQGGGVVRTSQPPVVAGTLRA